MNKFIKEFVLWILILLPIIYLASIWQNLPSIVPTHFSNSGVANGWSHKSILIYVTCGLGVGFYLIMLVIPFLDQKKNIMKMGQKYYNIRFILTFFIALILTFLIYSSNGGTFKNPNIHLLILGTIFAIFGIIMKTLEPNNFIGIRTPWAMESDYNWKKTHQLAAPIWFWSGIILDAFPFISPHKAVKTAIVLGIAAIMVIVPFVYSYIVYRNEDVE
jgi:uncharacterized membrane protein